jgi:hypothetical protein
LLSKKVNSTILESDPENFDNLGHIKRKTWYYDFTTQVYKRNPYLTIKKKLTMYKHQHRHPLLIRSFASSTNSAFKPLCCFTEEEHAIQMLGTALHEQLIW